MATAFKPQNLNLISWMSKRIEVGKKKDEILYGKNGNGGYKVFGLRKQKHKIPSNDIRTLIVYWYRVIQ